MDPKNLNSYVGVVNQPPPKWSSVKKWLLHINYAPGYAPEPEQKPVCRQFSRCEGCPYGKLYRNDSVRDNDTSVQSQPPPEWGPSKEGGRQRSCRG